MLEWVVSEISYLRGGHTKRIKMATAMELDMTYIDYLTRYEAEFIKILEMACLDPNYLGNPECKAGFKAFWISFTLELKHRCPRYINDIPEAAQWCSEYAQSLRKKYRGSEGSGGADWDALTRVRLSNIFDKSNLYFPSVFSPVSSQSGRSRSSDASVPSYLNPAMRSIPAHVKDQLALAYQKLICDRVMSQKDCATVDSFISGTEISAMTFLGLSQREKEAQVRNIIGD